jgi:hypothetical protein
MTRATFAALAVCLLSGCDNIPYHNLAETPLSITADSQDYITCKPYSLSDDGGFGQTSYTISFKNASDGNSGVTRRGVKKLTIIELPVMVALAMPSILPNIKTDHPSDGGPYREGETYTWNDGSQAAIHDGQWTAIKHRNPVCGNP